VIHEIDVDVYRALAYPVLQDRPYRFRVYYSHLLDVRDGRVTLPFLRPGWNDGRGQQPRQIRYRVRGEGSWLEALFGDAAQADEETGDEEDGFRVWEFEEQVAGMAEVTHIEAQAPVPEELAVDGVEFDVASHRTELGDAWFHGVFDPNLPAELRGAPRKVGFVLDRSGSMSGGKMVEAVKAVKACLSRLDSRDRFAIAAFESGAEVFDAELRPGTGTDQMFAGQWLDELSASGGTNYGIGLERMLELLTDDDDPAEIIFVTDGHPSVGLEGDALVTWLAERLEGLGITLHVVGIGSDLDGELLRTMANLTQGAAVFALEDSEIVGQVRDMFDDVRPGGLRDPALTMAPEVDGWQTSLGRSLWTGAPVEIGGTSRLGETVTVTLTGRRPDGGTFEGSWSLAIPPAGVGIDSRTAPALYSGMALTRLYRTIERTGENDELLLAAATTARKFGVVGRYSGYLALDEEAQYAERGIRRIRRDEAWVALDDLADTPIPATREGGDGALDGSQSDPWAGGGGADEAGGCFADAAPDPYPDAAPATPPSAESEGGEGLGNWGEADGESGTMTSEPEYSESSGCATALSGPTRARSSFGGFALLLLALALVRRRVGVLPAEVSAVSVAGRMAGAALFAGLLAGRRRWTAPTYKRS
jgi:MYXO-CTERM domain-containing protein